MAATPRYEAFSFFPPLQLLTHASRNVSLRLCALDGGAISTIFHVKKSATLILSALSIQNALGVGNGGALVMDAGSVVKALQCEFCLLPDVLLPDFLLQVSF